MTKRENHPRPIEHKTIYDKDFKFIDTDFEFAYQKKLTANLDSFQNEFDQNKLNEIILWKVNRYADFSEEVISKLNSINPRETQIDVEKTTQILKLLLNTKGVQLALASTILRFRNRNIYQIIDQRVYRIISEKKELNIKTHPNEKNINEQIKLYIQYLKDLRQKCLKLNIPFENADRILYMADKRINKEHKIRN